MAAVSLATSSLSLNPHLSLCRRAATTRRDRATSRSSNQQRRISRRDDDDQPQPPLRRNNSSRDRRCVAGDSHPSGVLSLSSSASFAMPPHWRNPIQNNPIVVSHQQPPQRRPSRAPFRRSPLSHREIHQRHLHAATSSLTSSNTAAAPRQQRHDSATKRIPHPPLSASPVDDPEQPPKPLHQKFPESGEI